MILIESHRDIPKIQKELETAKSIALDVETTGLDPYTCKWRLLQLEINDTIFIVMVENMDMRYVKYIVELVQSVDEIIGHNIKFDAQIIYANTGIMLLNTFDTMLAEVILTLGYLNKKYNLASLVATYKDIYLDKDTRMDFVNSPVITEEMLIYAGLDVKYLREIAEIQKVKLAESGQLFVSKLENALTPAISEMELTGVPLDRDNWKNLADATQVECNELEEKLQTILLEKVSQLKVNTMLELYDMLHIPAKTKKKREYLTNVQVFDIIKEEFLQEFNINSTAQLQAFLATMNIHVKSTAEKVLKRYSTNEFVNILLEYKEKFKRLTSFGYNILDLVNPVTNRLHPDFNQMGARTGRMACSKPNLQQAIADARYRNNHVAGEGKLFVVADYSQQELRIQAFVTQEPRMIEAFKNGEDPHAVTASVIYKVPLEEVTKEQRSKAKSLNFALSYGSSANGLVYNFGFTEREAGDLLDAYWEGHPNILKSMSDIRQSSVRNGFSTTLIGRRRYYPTKALMTQQEINKYHNAVSRQSFNHKIQGSGADMTKLALALIYKHNPFGDKLKLILAVHDEIVCEVDEEIAEDAKEFITAQMLQASKHIIKDFPMKVDPKISKYWEH